jgi:TatD DNase family protein
MTAQITQDIPTFHTPIIETHCHLDYLQAADPAAMVMRAHEQGVQRIVTIAVAPDNLTRVRAIAAQHQAVYCTQGVHPHEASHYTVEVGAQIRAAAAADPKVVAIGEIGLDYHYDHAPRQQQQKAFAEQLQIACDLGKPIVVHTRDADADTQAILADFTRHGLRGVIHSFTSGLPLAEFCLAEGFALGFNGIITFRSADNVRAVLAQTPITQILLETDAPYLTPVPFRGRENAPFYLPLIAQAVASAKGLQPEAAILQTTLNAEQLFFPNLPSLVS